MRAWFPADLPPDDQPDRADSAGEEIVDLVDRRRGTFDDAHVQDLLQRLDRLERAHEGRARTAVVRGEGVDAPGDRQVRVRGEVQVGEAVVEREAARLVDVRGGAV